MTPAAPSDHPFNPLLSDKRLLVYLFVGLRLMLLIAHQPLALEVPQAGTLEQGMTVYGDYRYHFGVAQSAASGLWPYRDFWYEYPPLIPMLSQVCYALSGGSFTTYANALAALLLAFDTANLLLVWRLGARLHGEPTGAALAWIYALCAAPLIALFWNFEAVVTFSLLLSALWLVEGRDLPAAGAVAFGALVKLVPLVALATAWRFREAGRALRLSAAALIVTGAGLGAVLLIGAQRGYGWPSLTAQFNKASHQTVWALLDGNHATGLFAGDRQNIASAYTLRGNPPVVPWWARTGLFACLGVFAFATTRRHAPTDSAGLVAFLALTLTLFYLWSPGWSPQWQVTLVPLILLVLPNRNGALLCLVLAAFSFAEYPLLFARSAGGVVDEALLPFFRVTVLGRTAVLAGFAALLYAQLRRPEARQKGISRELSPR